MKTLYYILFGLMLLTEFSMLMQLLTGKKEIDLPFLTAMLIIGGLAYFFFSKANPTQNISGNSSAMILTEIKTNFETPVHPISTNKKPATLSKPISENITKGYLKKLFPRIKEFSLSLEKKEVFIDIPWVWVNGDNTQQKFIFKRNGELIMSLNGQVTIGKWEYIHSAKCLLIDRIHDKILLNHGFFDEAVMILKMDGLNGENFILANEQLIPDLDIEKYLKDLYYSKNNIKIWHLENGQPLEIHNSGALDHYYFGSKATIDMKEIPNGTYKSRIGNKIEIQDSKVQNVFKYAKVDLNDGLKIVIEYAIPYLSFLKELPFETGNKVFLEDGITPLQSGKYKVKPFQSFKVEGGKIVA